MVCSAGFLRVATANDTYNYTFMINWVDISSEVSTSVKFVDAVVANNGKVIFAPTEEDAVGVFDPCSNTFEAVDISSYQLTGLARKFYSAALAKDGRVVFAPAHANGVGVFDPRDNSFELVPISSYDGMTGSMGAFVTLSNGEMVSPPRTATAVGVFNPVTKAFRTVPITVAADNDDKFHAAALTNDGKVVLNVKENLRQS